MRRCSICKGPSRNPKAFTRPYHPVTIYACEACLDSIANFEAKHSRQMHEKADNKGTRIFEDGSWNTDNWSAEDYYNK